MNFFTLWLDNYFYRDFQRTTCLQRCEEFLQEIQSAGLEEWDRRLKLIILRRIGHEPRSALFLSQLSGEDTKSKKSGKRLSSKKRSRANSVADGEASFDTLTAADIAEQLTLREWEMFRVIPESDFLDKVFNMKPPPPNNALTTMVEHFNMLSMWVAAEIVHTEDLKDRANVLKKFGTVCEMLFDLGNFNSLMAIVAGLTLGCVQRLRQTWSVAGSSVKQSYERFFHIMSTKHNFQSYRHALSITKLPAVPYLGVYFRDIVFIEEGNPLKLPNGMFNFDRIQLLGRLMLEISRFKRIPYDIPVLPAVQAYFAQIKTYDDEELYAASFACESDSHDGIMTSS